MMPSGRLLNSLLPVFGASRCRRTFNRWLLLALFVAGTPPTVTGADRWTEMRMQMIDEIQADMRAVMRRELSPQVVTAMTAVERHKFVPERLQRSAYDNRPLPIGREQTISQPFIVALMTELLEVDGNSRVLEIGTGSGYQAAVLAEICDSVYSIEIIASLAGSASRLLKELGYINVSVKHGDGTLGWPGRDPFDGIIVTAAGVEIPDALLDQLAPGGRLVMPVGPEFEVQALKVIEKGSEGFTERDVLPVRFVPITHDVR